MKYFTIMDDNFAHTVVYFVKAIDKNDALEKYAINVIGAQRTSNNKWYVKDYGNIKYDKYYSSTDELINGEMKVGVNKERRVEIMEIDFDPEAECQEIFCSKEKEIEN
jgi:hypothetical protein